MNKEDLSLLKTPLHPSDGLMTFYPDSTSNNNKESPYLTKEPQNPPRKRLNTHSNHKAGSASSYDKKRQDRTILIPSEMGYRQNFLSEKTENGQRLPQSATSNLSKRRVKVRTGSGSSKIPVDAAWSTVVQGGVPVEGIQNGKENRVNEGVRVSEAEAGRISCNTTAVFGDSGALNVVQKSSGNRFQVRNISTPTTHIIKEDNSPMSAVEFSSTKSGVKLGSQRELMDSQASNRYMEFTLSGFMKENNAENRSESQKGTRRENQSLALDTRKGNNDEQQRFSGVHSSREERERPRNIVIHRENSHDLRKSNQLGIPSYGSMVPGNKSMETSQERAKGTKRKEYENSNTPSQEYGKSPRSRLLLNLTHNKKSNSYTPEHENIGVKKLVEENSHLRKENDQKEELIGLLINALKQKEASNNNPLDLSPTPLPTIESYLSPKDNVQRFSFNRSRLTSAEKPFSSGTPNRFTQKSHGLIVPSRDGLGEIVAVERGRSNEAVRLFENSTAQTLPTLSIPSAQKSQLITVVDQSRVQTVNEILSAKRIYSSPLPKQPEHENFSHYPPGFGPNRISMQKNMMLKGNPQHHPLINLKSNLNGNGRVLMSYQQLPEGKPEYESLPKVNMHEYEYGFQRRKSRDTSSEYVLKQGVPEIKILSMNNMDTLGSQKMKDPTPLNAMFNPGEFITGTFQSKNFRVKSPGQRYNSQLNLDSKIKSQEDMKYQSACEIDAKTVLSSNRETEFSGLKAANGLKEVKSYGSLQKEVVQREGSRLQNMYKNNENREFGHGEREGKSVEELSKSKTRKDKFPKEVFSMNIRRKFFC